MSVVGHAGGWDEILSLVAPAVLFFVIYRVSRGRARRAEGADRDEAAGSDADRASDPPRR